MSSSQEPKKPLQCICGYDSKTGYRRDIVCPVHDSDPKLIPVIFTDNVPVGDVGEETKARLERWNEARKNYRQDIRYVKALDDEHV